ncbi:quinone-dependent dihydroorotate dehydrogenase [Hyphomicrobium sp.]|jgi:dihydroorotate dehydrogenase|uniref:quinone-dependent dihydroorotate dehydrogenase n=1 Tax=Hyphomicrobium sp. TaxID=82 RepID=UPI002C70DE2D|nr:quinone-dependent dihydroorotate dehydrogenase [Hyphomicrobium sp.]HVZ05676.1 quinone-dependent dihydroorotate dehydrogenase [Hyphomicrobium sp.]
MLSALYRFARPALFSLSPEDAHEATLRALELGLHPRQLGTANPILRQTVFGLDFPNPIGVAAGYDKDARVPDALLAMGCGFAEIGTVTPRPQPGNPKPRIFRLVNDRALINRLGFNNGGHDAALARLNARQDRAGIVGVNIGANKDSSDRTGDYVMGIEAFNSVASYFTVNISSPNTPGLRDLQAPAALEELLSRIMEARKRCASKGEPRRPIIVKIAPDIATEDIPAICERLLAHAVDGIAVSNTTLSRDGLKDSQAKETGGLSGRPLFRRSTIMLARIYEATEGKIPLIGIGGIDDGETALEKIEAGASLLQLYTGLVYAGPGLIGEIKAHVADTIHRRGYANIATLRGSKARQWAEMPL